MSRRLGAPIVGLILAALAVAASPSSSAFAQQPTAVVEGRGADRDREDQHAGH